MLVTKMLPEKLKVISAKIGKNPLLVQAAGGNTSIKEDEVLWVKASGKWLKHALEEQIFVPVKLSQVRQDIEIGLDDPVTANVLPGSKLRPSIETVLHAILPQKVVIHVHSVNTLSWAVLKNAQEKLQQLLSDINWSWIPYYRPGLPLAKAIATTLANKPQVFILANHGLIVAAEDIETAEHLLKEIDLRLSRPTKISHEINISELERIATNTGLQLPLHSEVHYLGLDTINFRRAICGVLYPDHVVFLGAKPFSIIAQEVAIDKINEYRQKYELPLYVIIENLGVLVSPEISLAAQEMLFCQSAVLSRLQQDDVICYLPDDEVAALQNWEAEKYRQQLIK